MKKRFENTGLKKTEEALIKEMLEAYTMVPPRPAFKKKKKRRKESWIK